MNRAIVYTVIGTLVVMGAVFGAGPIRRRFSELRADQALISGDTGDFMSSAAYQRFKAQRQAIAAMRDDLRRLASAESAFIADSGRPATNLTGTSYSTRGRGNVGPTIEIKRDRWIGTMTNPATPIMCQVTGLLDTAGRQQGPADIQCLGWAAVESTWAVANREAASRAAPPAAVTPEPDQPAAPPAPRPHRDWGPVNNKPPRTPWILENQCPGEYCSLGRWAACTEIPVYPRKQAGAKASFMIQSGEEFTALRGDVHVDVPGIVAFDDTVVNPGNAYDDSIRFIPADTLYVLDAMGEGYHHWWYRGRVTVGDDFWRWTDEVKEVREAQWVWWVRVRNAAGRDGWVQYDYHKMARDDRMDERSRCTRPAKG